MLNYLPLMTFNTDLKPIPGAAESFQQSADGLTFTFKSKPKVEDIFTEAFLPPPAERKVN